MKDHKKMDIGTKHIEWNGAKQQEAIDILLGKGHMIVSPTKVGYIIMTSDVGGLKRKFSAKQRALNTNAMSHIPDDGSREMMMDSRGTSCFVIRFGVPSEIIADELWSKHNKLVFASSANPSGKGNSGRVAGIGNRISDEADLVIGADEFVRSIQPGTSEHTRYEQGVMVLMVDTEGVLIPEQKGNRLIQPGPIVIRKGLDINKILSVLSERFPSWDYRHGAYY